MSLTGQLDWVQKRVIGDSIPVGSLTAKIGTSCNGSCGSKIRRPSACFSDNGDTGCSLHVDIHLRPGIRKVHLEPFHRLNRSKP